MRAWLTPDTPVPTKQAYRVVLPDDDVMRSAFWGAFLLLCRVENWEQFGTMTPDQAALVFEECWQQTYITGSGMVEVT